MNMRASSTRRVSATVLLATALLMVSLIGGRAWAQGTAAPAIPVRITWGDVGTDGVVPVTLINDSPQTITAYALQTVGQLPDGTTAPLAWIRVDALAATFGNKLTGAVLVACPALAAGATCTQPVQVSQSPWSGPFSVLISAVVYDDGTVTGPRSAVGGMLADREGEADAAEKWRTLLLDVAQSSERASADAKLLTALASGPAAERSSLAIRNALKPAQAPRQTDAGFSRAVADALRVADVHIAENRRHLAVQR